MKITVVGAGVVGLTCAVELQAAGHDVTVVAARTGEATTSAVAAAIWFPYR
ncbi:MAG: FAD-binding oxidoreductase, partial [Myxococcales bacterium]|nr:FAD-binding oxidoreductase [Myxococcales bacterium]